MNGSDAYRLELETAMVQARLAGDIAAAEQYQEMLDEYEENCEDDTVSSYLAECGL